MNKRDLITLRDNASDDDMRRALRYAVSRIDILEEQLREVHVLCKALQRAASFREEEK